MGRPDVASPAEPGTHLTQRTLRATQVPFHASLYTCTTNVRSLQQARMRAALEAFGTVHEVLIEVMDVIKTASTVSGWYTRDDSGGRREAVDAERMHNQHSQHASERSRAGHPPRAPLAEPHYAQDPVLQAQMQAYAASFRTSEHLGYHSLEAAADRNPGQPMSSSQYQHRPVSAGYSEQEIVGQAVDFFSPGSLASGDGRTTSLPVARNPEWQGDFGQRHASYDGQGAGRHDAFHPEPHDQWAAFKDIRLRSPDEARAATIMNELKVDKSWSMHPAQLPPSIHSTFALHA